MQIKINKSKILKSKPDDSKLGFGRIFTDHMFNIDFEPQKGWHNPRIEPYAPIAMDPSTIVLHYGQAIFEGLKAFRTASGQVCLFRARDNFIRFNKSARSLCIPEMDIDFMLTALKELLQIDRDWIPGSPGTSLYIRPTIIATDCFLGVRASKTYRCFIILSPVGAYYAAGFNPVKILVTREYVRAVRGGLGESKTPANYAASLYAGEDAAQQGYAQVLWLDGVEQQYIEEVGSMNIFFLMGDELITPALNGSILPGVTRDTVIKLAPKWNLKVSERKISIDEILNAHAQGNLKEVFGSGTAAVISPVGEMKYNDQTITIGEGKVGPLANKLFKTITSIQYGSEEDQMGWIENLS